MNLSQRIQAHARAGVRELIAEGRRNCGVKWMDLYVARLTTFALELGGLGVKPGKRKGRKA